MKLRCTACNCECVLKDEHGDGHAYWLCADCKELLAHMFPNGELEIF